MTSLLRLATVAVIASMVLATIVSLSYKWGYNAARLDNATQANKTLASQAQAAIDYFAEAQKIEDIILSSDDNSRIDSPVLMRTLERVSERAAADLQNTAPKQSLPQDARDR